MSLDPVCLLHGAVPVVLDGIIRAADEDLCEFRPLVRCLPLKHEENPFLDAVPLTLLYDGIQVMEPPLAQSFGGLVVHLSRDLRPLLAELLDENNQLGVLIIVELDPVQ